MAKITKRDIRSFYIDFLLYGMKYKWKYGRLVFTPKNTGERTILSTYNNKAYSYLLKYFIKGKVEENNEIVSKN